MVIGNDEIIERTSKSPRSKTAIKVSSFRDSRGFRIAAPVFRKARPKTDRPSCWSPFRTGELPENARATEEVARDKGESGDVCL